jgi:hypothetical protein
MMLLVPNLLLLLILMLACQAKAFSLAPTSIRSSGHRLSLFGPGRGGEKEGEKTTSHNLSTASASTSDLSGSYDQYRSSKITPIIRNVVPKVTNVRKRADFDAFLAKDDRFAVVK